MSALCVCKPSHMPCDRPPDLVHTNVKSMFTCGVTSEMRQISCVKGQNEVKANLALLTHFEDHSVP